MCDGGLNSCCIEKHDNLRTEKMVHLVCVHVDLVLLSFFVVYSRLRTAVFHNQDQELNCESATLDG